MPITTPERLIERYKDLDHFDNLCEHLIVPAVEEAGFRPITPKSSNAEVIQAEIIRNLSDADIVLCDFSTLNPNVMYELGIRTALDKPTIHIRDTHTTHLPFDMAIVNCHTYNPSLHISVVKREVPKLAAHIEQSWADVKEGSHGKQNAMWRVFGIETAGALDKNATSNDVLQLLLDEVRELRASQHAEVQDRHKNIDLARERQRWATVIRGVITRRIEVFGFSIHHPTAEVVFRVNGPLSAPMLVVLRRRVSLMVSQLEKELLFHSSGDILKSVLVAPPEGDRQQVYP